MIPKVAIISFLVYFFYIYIKYSDDCQTITITNLDKQQELYIPLMASGWINWKVEILENTGNDSIYLFTRYFAAGETRKFTLKEVYKDKQDGFRFAYYPYKAKTGEIVLRICISK